MPQIEKRHGSKEIKSQSRQPTTPMKHALRHPHSKATSPEPERAQSPHLTPQHSAVVTTQYRSTPPMSTTPLTQVTIGQLLQECQLRDGKLEYNLQTGIPSCFVKSNNETACQVGHCIVSEIVKGPPKDAQTIGNEIVGFATFALLGCGWMREAIRWYNAKYKLKKDHRLTNEETEMVLKEHNKKAQAASNAAGIAHVAHGVTGVTTGIHVRQQLSDEAEDQTQYAAQVQNRRHGPNERAQTDENHDEDYNMSGALRSAQSNRSTSRQPHRH